MTALIVILAVLLCLFLVSLIRVGVVAEYDAGGLALRIRVGPIKFAVYPGREKPEKKQKKKPREKKEKPKQPKPSEEKSGGKLELVKQMLPLVADAAGAVKRRLCIDTLVLRLTWAADNPASAALGYGMANAAVGVLYALLDQNFVIRDQDVGVSVDFQREQPELYLKAALSLTIGQGVAFAFHFGIRFLSVWTKGRGSRSGHEKKKEAVRHE